MTLLLDRGAKIDATDAAYQQTALMVAVRENLPDLVKLLIARGASVNGRTRVGRAPAWVLPEFQPGFGHGIGIVRGGSPDRGRRAPIPGGMTPLLYAASDGRMETVRMLLDAGAEINARDANDITPLIAAITNNHPDVARYLIERGADIKASGLVRPHAALGRGRNAQHGRGQRLVREQHRPRAVPRVDPGAARPRSRSECADKGSAARPSGVPSHYGIAVVGDFTGQTPFITAALAGDVTVMKLLLKHGADPNIPTFAGTTALMAAAA